MKYRGVISTPVERTEDVRKFFDGIAHEYADKHGNPDKLLKYRLNILKKEAFIRDTDVILELCCGTGDHLMALAEITARAVGIDLSPKMVEVTNTRIVQTKLDGKTECWVDNATRLDTLGTGSFDKVICVGSLEHIPDKPAVIEAVFRVLKPNGIFVCLTVNSDYLWYSHIAPLLKINTHHLSSDKFLTRGDIQTMVGNSQFNLKRIGYWSFIPRGDMPSGVGLIFTGLDHVGRLFKIRQLRGGIFFTIIKPGLKLV